MLRSDESEALFPGDLGVNDATDARLRALDIGGGIRTESLESFAFNDATRLAVDEERADICIGGKAATGFWVLGSLPDETVWRKDKQ